MSRARWLLLVVVALAAGPIPEPTRSSVQRPGEQTGEVAATEHAAPTAPEADIEGPELEVTHEWTIDAAVALIRGVVRDSVAGVVPGATVTVLRDEGTPIAAVSCDGEASFSLRIPARPVELLVEAQGYASRRIPVVPPASLEIILYPESSVRGRVVRADDRSPVPDVEVVIVPEGVAGVADLRQWRATSDRYGEFEIDGVAPGLHDVSVSSVEWVAAAKGPIAVPFGEDVSEVEVLVEQSLHLAGRVVTDEEAYCHRGTITAVEPDLAHVRSADFELGETVVIGGLVEGVYDVSVTCAEGAQTTYPPMRLARSIEDRAWRVKRGFELTGRLVDFAGKPVPGLSVIVHSRWARRRSAPSGPDGAFQVLGLDRGRYSLSVDGVVRTAPNHVLIPRAGKLAITIEPPGNVRGRVVSLDHEPLPFFVVSTDQRTTVADHAGRFMLREVPAGPRVLVSRHPDWSLSSEVKSSRQPIHVESGQTTTTTVVVPISLGLIRGFARDDADFPVAGAIVSAYRIGDGERPASVVAMKPDRGVTDSEGRFALRLPQGGYDIVGQAPGRSEGRVRAWTGDRIRLQMSRVGRILGTAIYADGTRPTSMTVSLRGSRYVADHTFRNRDASFSFSDVPFGSYTLEVRAERGGANTPMSVEEMLVELPRPVMLASGQVLKGRFARPFSGLPVVGVSVELVQSGSRRPIRNVTRGDGRFEFSGVLPGRASLTIRAPDDRTLRRINVTLPSHTLDLGDIELPSP